MAQCKLCGAVLGESEFQNHIWEYHCLNYRDYYEVIKTIPDPEECWRCGSIKYPLSYMHPDFPGIPCWGCIKKKSQIESTKKQVLETMKEYRTEVLGNKYYRHIISDPNTFSMSLTHSLPGTAGLLDSVARKNRLKIDNRNEVFSVFPRCPGYSEEISERNLEFLGMSSIPVSYEEAEPGVYEVIIGQNIYHIELPEIVPYEVRHHQRSSILNKTKSARPNGKRLRMGRTDKVYKFYDTPDSVMTKSIFRVREEKVKEYDKIALGYILMSGKVFSDIVVEIYDEICPSLSGIYDRVFFKNHILLSLPSNSSDFEIEFSMNSREISKDILTIQIWS